MSTPAEREAERVAIKAATSANATDCKDGVEPFLESHYTVLQIGLLTRAVINLAETTERGP